MMTQNEKTRRFRSVAPLILAGVLLSTARGASPTGHAPASPNVVLILADDLGWADVGCYGADLHETPRIDALAAEGVRFTNAYAASPVCSPTRASILTGKHPARLGITTWREAALVPTKDRPLLPPAAVADLPASETTLAEALQTAGYLTASVGKWHLGDADHAPESNGFDVNIGGTHWGAPATYFFPYRGPFGQAREFRYVPHLEFGRPGEHLTGRLADEAVRVIERATSTDRPFFLLLAQHAPHTPIEADRALVERYEAKLRPDARHRNPAYAAMVQSLDESVGRILDKLEALGIADRTLVIFTSDNGGLVGTHAGLTVTNNAPLRSGKGSLYEGGVRVPMIIRWPTVASAGAVRGDPVVSTDLYKTILEAAGLNDLAGADRGLDGLSLAPLLRAPGERIDGDSLFFHYPHYYPTTTPASAVRAGDWKLLEYYEDRRVELYNLNDDPGEANDLAARLPDKADELRRRLAAWREAVGAKAPTSNPAYVRPAGR